MRIVGTILIVVAVALAATVAWCAFRATTFPIASLTRSAPRRTALMLQREAEARAAGKRYRIDQRWVSYDRVSPLLRRSILVAEDASFFEHGGLDWHEIGASARRNLEKRRVARGGSTITQQLARNLYLGDQRTLTRKLTEAFLAIRLEREIGKRRIFELYLNLIEWGDGIFGIEAASRRYFGVPASALSQRQAVLLAAVIINPRKYSVLEPQRRIERRARMIAGRLRKAGALDSEGYRIAIAEPAPPPTETLPVAPDSIATVALADSNAVPEFVEPVADTAAVP